MTHTLRVLTLGSAANVLDIYLSVNGVATNATNVGYELIDAADVVSFSGIALNPSTGSYTASGTIPALRLSTGLPVQLGEWEIRWNIITSAGIFQSATEDFFVNAVDLKIGFLDSADVTETIYDAVRLDIGDPEASIFDDGFLSRILIKAVRRLNRALGLSVSDRPKGIPGNFGGQRIKVNPIVANLSAGTITPNNDEIYDLVVLQMEVIILESETSALKRLAASSTGPFASFAGSASQDGISVTNADGVSISISPSRLSSRFDLHKFDVKSRKEELKDAILQYLARMTGSYSKMIY